MTINIFDQAKDIIREISQRDWEWCDVDEVKTPLSSSHEEYSNRDWKKEHQERKTLAEFLKEQRVQPKKIPNIKIDENFDNILNIIYRAFKELYVVDSNTQAYSEVYLAEVLEEKGVCTLYALDSDKINFEGIIDKINHLKTIAPKTYKGIKDADGKEYVFVDDKAYDCMDGFLLETDVPEQKVANELVWFNQSTGDIIPYEKSDAEIQGQNFIKSAKNIDLEDTDQIAKLYKLFKAQKEASRNDDSSEKIEKEMQQKGYEKIRIYDKSKALEMLRSLGIEPDICRGNAK